MLEVAVINTDLDVQHARNESAQLLEQFSHQLSSRGALSLIGTSNLPHYNVLDQFPAS
ncbi:hypothetical protein D3C73_1461570 [compost metagenome]